MSLLLEYHTFLTIHLRGGDAFLSAFYRKTEIEKRGDPEMCFAICLHLAAERVRVRHQDLFLSDLSHHFRLMKC